jgi:hypothetical protein
MSRCGYPMKGIIYYYVLGDEAFRPANLDDLQHIQQICGDFLDQYEQRIANGENVGITIFIPFGRKKPSISSYKRQKL